MKIYVVIWEISPYWYKDEDWKILWIFSTRELAEERKTKENYYKYVDIEEYELDYFKK